MRKREFLEAQDDYDAAWKAAHAYAEILCRRNYQKWFLVRIESFQDRAGYGIWLVSAI